MATVYLGRTDGSLVFSSGFIDIEQFGAGQQLTVEFDTSEGVDPETGLLLPVIPDRIVITYYETGLLLYDSGMVSTGVLGETQTFTISAESNGVLKVQVFPGSDESDLFAAVTSPSTVRKLFSNYRDTINFGSLLEFQEESLEDEQEDGVSPLQRYFALGGDDRVALPSLGSILPGGWDSNQVFNAGDGNDAVSGRDRNDKIDGASGEDTILGGGGNDTIRGGIGSDTLSGGTGKDTAVLSGRPSDYEMVDNLGSGTTTLRSKSTGEIDTIDTFESFKFDVTLGDNQVVIKNAYLTMAQLSEHAYRDTPFAKGWRPLHAHELDLPIKDAGGKWTLANGVFKSGSAVAHIYAAKATLPNGTVKDTLALAFRGSDPSVGDPWDIPAWNNRFIENYYAKFKPLLDAVESYAATQGIDQVLVTGHSLGGAVAQRFMHETAVSNPKYAAATFGSIGYGSARNDLRIVHFEHTDDIARIIQDPTTELQGEIVRISSGVSERSGRIAEHSMSLYVETVTNLVLAGSDASSIMTFKARQPDFASHWAVGDNGDNILRGDDYAGQIVYSPEQRDETLLGLKGNDRLYGYRGADTLKGGDGADALYGGLDKDVLVGGRDSDVFWFNSVRETKPGLLYRDTIRDFTTVDLINLSKMDADTDTLGNQAFKWVNRSNLEASFSGVDGQLRFAAGLLQGDINGDKRADFEIRVFGTVTAADVIL